MTVLLNVAIVSINKRTDAWRLGTSLVKVVKNLITIIKESWLLFIQLNTIICYFLSLAKFWLRTTRLLIN